jgi:hypothetical protein
VTLHEVLAEAVADLDDVEAIEDTEGVEWRRGGRPFAAAGGGAA